MLPNSYCIKEFTIATSTKKALSNLNFDRAFVK